MNKSIKFCEGENIYLRPYNELLDLDLFYFGENNPEVRDSLFLHSPLSKNEAKEKIEEWISKSENINGIKAYENADFAIEGTLSEAMYHNNEYVDFYVMRILRKEFYEER